MAKDDDGDGADEVDSRKVVLSDGRTATLERELTSPIHMEASKNRNGALLFLEVLPEPGRVDSLRTCFGISADAKREHQLLLIEIAVNELLRLKEQIEAGEFKPTQPN